MVLKFNNEGGQKAKEEILEYFKPMINKIIKNTYILGYDDDDMYQMAIIVILQAIKKIDLSKYHCVESYIYSSIKNYFYTQRVRAINRGVNLSLNYKDDEEDGNELIDRLQGDCNIEEEYLLKEDLIKLEYFMKDLEEEEKKFLKEIYSYGYGGIAAYSKEHNKSYAYCYKMKERLIRKLRKSMEVK